MEGQEQEVVSLSGDRQQTIEHWLFLGDVFFSLGGGIMSDPSYRAEHCRDLAEECRRLAATTLSSQMRNRYSLMAENYSTLAKTEAIGGAKLRSISRSQSWPFAVLHD